MNKKRVKISTSFSSIKYDKENSNDSSSSIVNFIHPGVKETVDNSATKSEVRKAVTLFWEDYNSVLSTLQTIGKEENCKFKYELLRACDIEELKLENRILRGIIDGLNNTVVDLRIRVYELSKSKNRYKREKIELKTKLDLEIAEVNYLTKISGSNLGDPSVVRKIAKLEKLNREIVAKYEKLIIDAKNDSKIEPENNNNLIKKEKMKIIPSMEFSMNNIIMGYKLMELFRTWNYNSLSYNNSKNVTKKKISENNVVIREIFSKTSSTCMNDEKESSIIVKECSGIGYKKSTEFIESCSQTIGGDKNPGYYIEGNKATFLIGKIDFEVLVKMHQHQQQHRNDDLKMTLKTSSDSSTQTLIKNLEDRGVNGSKNIYDYYDDYDNDNKDKRISYLKMNNSNLSCSNRRVVRFNPDVKYYCLIDEIDVTKTRSSFMKRTKFIQGANDYLLKKKLLNNNNNNYYYYNYIPLRI